MKNKNIKGFGEFNENLNSELSKETSSSISDVRSSKIDEFFGGSENEYKHKLEDVNIDLVLEGLDIIRHYNPREYQKYFGDRIFKSYKPETKEPGKGGYFG